MAAVLPAVALAPVQTVRSLIPERSATSQTGSVLAWIAGPIFGVVDCLRSEISMPDPRPDSAAGSIVP